MWVTVLIAIYCVLVDEYGENKVDKIAKEVLG